jgi:WS/DGAT/MGAT family acyltransferase
MEGPTNPMTITAVFTFAEPVVPEVLRALLTAKLLPHARFRQRVVDGGAGHVFWEDAPDFRLADHVVPVRLPAGAGQDALQAFVGELMSTPLAPDRPLWQFHLVEDYQGTSAMVARVHHCIGDGISLVQLLLAMAESPAAAAAGAPDSPPGGVERRKRVRYAPDAPACDVVTSEAPARSALADTLRTLVSPARVLTAARIGGGTAAVLGRLLDLRADPRTVLRGTLTTVKRAAWSGPIPLDAVRRVGKATGGTINDVLLSAVAGALGRYLRARGDRVDGVSLRAVVPVNLRRPDDLTSLGNKFGLVFLTLPVGETHPVRRVLATKRSMDRIKRSPEAAVVFGLLRAFGKTTAGTLVTAVRLLARRASAVVTNVPGPRTPIRFAGATVDGVMFWVPQSGRLGLGVSVLSYNGTVRVGIAADAALVPDPGDLVRAFDHALGELFAAAPATPGGSAPAPPRPPVPSPPDRVRPAPSAAPAAGPTVPA